MPRSLPSPAVIALLVAAALAAYAPLWSAGFVTGDAAATFDAPALREPGGLLQLWGEPARWAAEPPLLASGHALLLAGCGPSPRAAHAASALLHLLAALGVWRLGARLGLPGAALGALAFAVHPLAVESVAWVAARANPLGLALALAAALQALRWLGTRRRGHGALAALLWLAAALSHPALAVLPWLLPLLGWWRPAAVDGRARRLGLGLGAAGAAWVAAAAWAPAAAPPLATRLLGIGPAAWHGLAGAVWPFGRSFHCPAPPPALLPSLGAAAALLVLLAGLWGWRHRLGRGPLATGLAWLLLLLPQAVGLALPPLQQANLADRLHYQGLVPLLLAAAAAAATAAPRGAPALLPAAAALLGLLLGGTSSWQATAYRDAETLWRRTLAAAPDSALALTNLGALALERGEPRAAKAWFEQSLAVQPEQAEAIANLGVIAHREGDLAAAKQHYLRALDLQPGLTTAMHNLAVLQLGAGETAEALGLLEVALALDANYYDARVAVVQALHGLQRWAELRPHAEWVLARTPAASATRARLAEALLGLDEDGLAAGHAAFLLQREPGSGNARRLLATALAKQVAKGPAEGAGRRALQGCRQGGVDAAAVLPLVAAELRRRGAEQHANDVAQQPSDR